MLFKWKSRQGPWTKQRRFWNWWSVCHGSSHTRKNALWKKRLGQLWREKERERERLIEHFEFFNSKSQTAPNIPKLPPCDIGLLEMQPPAGRWGCRCGSRFGGTGHGWAGFHVAQKPSTQPKSLAEIVEASKHTLPLPVCVTGFWIWIWAKHLYFMYFKGSGLYQFIYICSFWSYPATFWRDADSRGPGIIDIILNFLAAKHLKKQGQSQTYTNIPYINHWSLRLSQDSPKQKHTKTCCHLNPSFKSFSACTMHYWQQNQLQYLSSSFHNGQHRSVAPTFRLTLESQCWLAEYFDKQSCLFWGAASVFGGVPPAFSGCLFKCELSYSPAPQENMVWTSPDLTSLLFVLLGLVWPLFAIIAQPAHSGNWT